MAEWVQQVQPRLLNEATSGKSRQHAKAAIIQRAVLYGELEAHPAFRDFVGIVERWRTQLLDDLRWGHLRRGRAFGTTDDEVRAMLYILGNVLEVPTSAKESYDRLRVLEDEAAKALHRAEERFGVTLEGE